MQRAAPRSASDASSGIASHIAATKSAHIVVEPAISHVFNEELPVNVFHSALTPYHIVILDFFMACVNSELSTITVCDSVVKTEMPARLARPRELTRTALAVSRINSYVDHEYYARRRCNYSFSHGATLLMEASAT